MTHETLQNQGKLLSQSHFWTEPTWLMWPWWVKIPTEDFTGETLVIGDTQLREMVLEVVIWVLVMEVDKVVDEVTDMEIDK